jgi:hypothetical protein
MRRQPSGGNSAPSQEFHEASSATTSVEFLREPRSNSRTADGCVRQSLSNRSGVSAPGSSRRNFFLVSDKGHLCSRQLRELPWGQEQCPEAERSHIRMSAWRRIALERLPELRKVIEESASPMALWIELLGEFHEAFSDDNQTRIMKILDFSRWCWRAADPDTVNAVACAFFEHLPAHNGMRASIPRWFSRAEFQELRSVFAYHADESILAEIEKQYRAARN